jgi:hypothetical protein
MRLSYEDIKEQQQTAEMLVNYWEGKDPGQADYYTGCYNALTWVLTTGEMFADDETNVLIEE